MREGRLGAVVNVEGLGQGATYSLREDHAALASDRLLRGAKVPAVALAAFLFRDHGLVLKKPAISNALSLFRSEFGLRSSVEDEAATFDLLFRDDSDDFEDADLVPADQAEG